VWRYTSTPLIRLRDVDRQNFNFTFYLLTSCRVVGGAVRGAASVGQQNPRGSKMWGKINILNYKI
jgi:hypothetical protein